MQSPNAFNSFGAGSSGFTIDPERDLTLAFLSTEPYGGQLPLGTHVDHGIAGDRRDHPLNHA
jgi:CubicO group peptidase (beta-lactamase class C family)